MHVHLYSVGALCIAVAGYDQEFYRSMREVDRIGRAGKVVYHRVGLSGARERNLGAGGRGVGYLGHETVDASAVRQRVCIEYLCGLEVDGEEYRVQGHQHRIVLREIEVCDLCGVGQDGFCVYFGVAVGIASENA